MNLRPPLPPPCVSFPFAITPSGSSVRPQRAYTVLQRWFDDYFPESSGPALEVQKAMSATDDAAARRADPGDSGGWKRAALEASGGRSRGELRDVLGLDGDLDAPRAPRCPATAESSTEEDEDALERVRSCGRIACPR